MPMTTPAARPGNPARTALLLLGLTFVLGVAARGVPEAYPVFVLPLEQAFGWSRAEVSGVYALSFMVLGLSSPLVGWLFDRFGPLRLYLLGIGISAGAVLAASQAQALWQIYACLGLMIGFGTGCLGMVPAAALLSRWFRGRLNLALAVAQASYGAGILLLAPSAQLLIDWQGWRAAYLAFTLVLLALLPLLALVRWRVAVAGHPDYREAPPAGGIRAATEATSLGTALRHPTFWGIMWCFTFTGVGMYAVALQTPAYLVSIGYTAQQAADAYGLVGLLLPIGLLAFGWLGDRIGRRWTVFIAFGFSISGMLGLVGLATGPSTPLLMLFVVGFGASFGSRGPALLTIAALSFRGPYLGRIYGFLTIGMGGGGAIGAWLGGVLHDMTGAYQAVMATGIVGLLLAALPFLFVRQMARA